MEAVATELDAYYAVLSSAISKPLNGCGVRGLQRRRGQS
jgi:hypothetical protein